MSFNGTVEIGGMKLSKDYTFTEFQKSPFFHGQDGQEAFQLTGRFWLDGNYFHVGLFFNMDRLRQIQFFCMNPDIKDEPHRILIYEQFIKDHAPLGSFDGGHMKIGTALTPADLSVLRISYD